MTKNAKKGKIAEMKKGSEECIFCSTIFPREQLFSYSPFHHVCVKCTDSLDEILDIMENESFEEDYYQGNDIRQQLRVIQNKFDSLTSGSSTPQTPSEYKAYLDRFVIGQNLAKKHVATEIFNHHVRISNYAFGTMPKNNFFMIGNTGVGKTFMIELMANILNVPFTIVDCGNLTQTGWKGNNVDTILASLFSQSGGDLEKAEQGIVLLDEIDKLAGSNSDHQHNTFGVQQALLKMIEGAETVFEVNRLNLQINTKNILFIGSGAFVGLGEVIRNRLNKNIKGIGFNRAGKENGSDDFKTISKVTHEDLINYGFMPEFVGRMSSITALHELSNTDLTNILTKTEDSIYVQYQNLFKSFGVDLELSKKLIDSIVEKAGKDNTGARALKQYMNEALKDAMYEVPSNNHKGKLVIDVPTKWRKLNNENSEAII